jgi:dUTP pyrophosphatase
MILSRQEILSLVQSEKPLIKEFVSLDDQLQPNGFDLTLRSLSIFTSGGSVNTGKDRVLSETRLVDANKDNVYNLPPSSYLVIFNEIVALPAGIMALGRPRSTLLRCGSTIGTAVWDAGYEGRSQALMTVFNPFGINLEKNAKLMQLVFMRLTKETDTVYRGQFNNENMS